MKSALIRTGSVPTLSSLIPSSPTARFSLSTDKTHLASPKVSLHFEVNRRGIRRALSESDLIRSTVAGSHFFPTRIPEEDEEFEFNGGGIGRGKKNRGGNRGDDFGRGGFIDGNSDRKKIGAYYQEMLKSNPTSSLLLRNYAKFLHEVERDTVKAEEYYGRAILANPGDGEVLSLYGKLIWETNKDEDRARSYFDQAVHASPDDCVVLGSYAQFMWEAAEEDEDEEEMEREVQVPAAMVEAF